MEQELRTGQVDLKRVQINRPVDGPLPVRRLGDTVIVPVVSETVRVERQWVLTEEIHLTRRDEIKTVQHTVQVKEETATAERLNAEGEIVQIIPPQPESEVKRETPESLLTRRPPRKSERVLSGSTSILQRQT